MFKAEIDTYMKYTYKNIIKLKFCKKKKKKKKKKKV